MADQYNDFVTRLRIFIENQKRQPMNPLDMARHSLSEIDGRDEILERCAKLLDAVMRAKVMGAGWRAAAQEVLGRFENGMFRGLRCKDAEVATTTGAQEGTTTDVDSTPHK